MIFRYLLASFSLFLLCSNASAATPCDILKNGNAEYSAKRFDTALKLYREVERVDPAGRVRCTASVYATMGTIYTTLGYDAQDAQTALAYYKNASKYNRAFANALLCSAGYCAFSEEFWSKKQNLY